MLLKWMQSKNMNSDKIIRYWIGIGLLCMSVGLMMKNLPFSFTGKDFLQGFLVGLSIPLNIIGLIFFGSNRRRLERNQQIQSFAES